MNNMDPASFLQSILMQNQDPMQMGGMDQIPPEMMQMLLMQMLGQGGMEQQQPMMNQRMMPQEADDSSMMDLPTLLQVLQSLGFGG